MAKISQIIFNNCGKNFTYLSVFCLTLEEILSFFSFLLFNTMFITFIGYGFLLSEEMFHMPVY